MSTKVNLWPFLSQKTQAELMRLANIIGTDLIYVRRNAYYERRNELIKRRYLKLKEETKMTNEEIYQHISLEISQILGTVTAKAVQNVIYAAADS